MTSTPAQSRIGEVAERLTTAVRVHYGPGPRVDELTDRLSAFRDDPRPNEPDALAEVEAAAQQVFRHVDLSTAADLQPQERSPGWPEPDLAAIRRAGADVAAALRDPDGSASIRLTGLAPVAAAAPLLLGAFGLVRDADPVIVDLRDNGGGDPATVVLIIDWLAGGGSRHLFDVVYADRVRQWWTAGTSPVPAPTGGVRALIGPRTASSAEALAWSLQSQGLATLVGQPTRGAADHVVPLNLTSDVRALIPEAHVAAPDGGPTWEGHGVQPDVSEAGTVLS